MSRRASALVGLVLLTPAATVWAERLPLKIYTTADGLPHNEINHIVRDSRGFLWICTADGLTRYDGYGFTTYTTEDGLPTRAVEDLLEARDGRYWIATAAGFDWSLRGQALDTLEQTPIAGAGRERQETTATFNRSKNQTTIKTITPSGRSSIVRPGLVLLEFVTDQGRVTIVTPGL